MTTIVTGMKPTGTPHLGNVLGMVRPTVELARRHDAHSFVADLHALTTAPDPSVVRTATVEVAATFLAFGLDPERSALYRQSDLPEVAELAAILASTTAKGLLNRAHAYKAAVDANLDVGREPDDGVNAGLYGYPVLMAADILAVGPPPGAGGAGFGVPVGLDQGQHLEIARAIARAFNARYGDVLTLPDAIVDDAVAVVPGTDGRKMSKSYGNTIPVLAPPDELARAVAGIVTDSGAVDEPRDPAAQTVFALFRLLADAESVEVMRRGYADGGIGHARAKRMLTDALVEAMREPRQRYLEVVGDPAALEVVLRRGAGRARGRARATLGRVREAVGLPALAV